MGMMDNEWEIDLKTREDFFQKEREEGERKRVGKGVSSLLFSSPPFTLSLSDD
jgi:hypothetical protein